jgi:hypothetical protein
LEVFLSNSLPLEPIAEGVPILERKIGSEDWPAVNEKKGDDLGHRDHRPSSMKEAGTGELAGYTHFSNLAKK